jgi:glucosamine--fructose-6-phosphate aminotransferase (isomerizing)
MCGIVGYVGRRAAQERLLAGLDRLEYRGYDSAGIALAAPDGDVETIRAVGDLRRLRAAVARRPVAAGVATLERTATTGIGHTRWATHGGVTEANAHPHADQEGRVHVVLNGIVENYVALRAELAADGCTFSSETDAEVATQLIGRCYDGDLEAAVRAACARLTGHWAFVAMDGPDLLVAARRGCPLVVGHGDGERFLASAIPAFLAHTARVQHLEDGDVVRVHAGGASVAGPGGRPRRRPVTTVSLSDDGAERGEHETFMRKELCEQPAAVRNTLAGRVDRAGAHAGFPELAAVRGALATAPRVVVVACGTSYHAGLVARHAFEQWARVPVEVDIASEYRYRNPIVGPADLVIGITQSGETADTLAAMRTARERGATVLAVTNVDGSQAVRDAGATVLTRAGLEVGVAATKTFVAQVAALHALALHVAEVRRALPRARARALARALLALPEQLGRTLAAVEAPAAALAAEVAGAPFFLYLGRHAGLPVALEGALKLKEISYAATDAYAAGEMKHGPIALLSPDTPVVCVATDSPVLDKVVSNIQEVRARGARVVAIASEGNAEIGEHCHDVLRVPVTDPLLQPVLSIVPLQLLAYHVARARGLDVDRPRNLAKTVTVE